MLTSGLYMQVHICAHVITHTHTHTSTLCRSTPEILSAPRDTLYSQREAEAMKWSLTLTTPSKLKERNQSWSWTTLEDWLDAIRAYGRRADWHEEEELWWGRALKQEKKVAWESSEAGSHIVQPGSLWAGHRGNIPHLEGMCQYSGWTGREWGA